MLRAKGSQPKNKNSYSIYRQCKLHTKTDKMRQTGSLNTSGKIPRRNNDNNIIYAPNSGTNSCIT